MRNVRLWEGVRHAYRASQGGISLTRRQAEELADACASLLNIIAAQRALLVALGEAEDMDTDDILLLGQGLVHQLRRRLGS